MNLKLEIYDKKQIIKTYETDAYSLKYGTIEDLINLVDLDGIDLEDDPSLIKVAVKVITKGLNILKPLFFEIFDGLNDNELRNTKISDLASILVKIIKFAVKEMLDGVSAKN